jgi:hypothetical protein
MEREVVGAITSKVTSTKEPKWITVMAKNVRHMVNQAVETLVNTPKQEERKLNLRLTGLKAKESEIGKDMGQWFNTKLL